MADGRLTGMRLGIAHHLGWAVAVTASDDHEIVDRRRIELVEAGLPSAPIHHEGGPHELHRIGDPLSDAQLSALVADVRASMIRATDAALDELVGALPTNTGDSIVSISLADWPDDFPTDIPTLRRPPFEAKADSVHYRQVLADAGAARGWAVHRFDPRRVEVEAAALLGDRADEVLHGPRRRLGAPWAKDHRMALAATVLAAAG